MKKKQKNSIVLAKSATSLETIPTEREGYFKEGRDKLGRPYEKKMDNNGIYTKKEILLDGTKKLTIKKNNKVDIQALDVCTLMLYLLLPVNWKIRG